MIWDAAKAGDKALLLQYLVGAVAEDLTFEKRDDVRHGNLYMLSELTSAMSRCNSDVPVTTLNGISHLLFIQLSFCYDCTALAIAAVKGCTDIVTVLVKAGADVNYRGSQVMLLSTAFFALERSLSVGRCFLLPAVLKSSRVKLSRRRDTNML
jgi:hypothetical protein